MAMNGNVAHNIFTSRVESEHAASLGAANLLSALMPALPAWTGSKFDRGATWQGVLGEVVEATEILRAYGKVRFWGNTRFFGLPLRGAGGRLMP